MLYDEDVRCSSLIATLAVSALLLEGAPEETPLTADQIIEKHVEALEARLSSMPFKH